MTTNSTFEVQFGSSVLRFGVDAPLLSTQLNSNLLHREKSKVVTHYEKLIRAVLLLSSNGVLLDKETKLILARMMRSLKKDLRRP